MHKSLDVMVIAELREMFEKLQQAGLVEARIGA
jgi:hypothetical protein